MRNGDCRRSLKGTKQLKQKFRGVGLAMARRAAETQPGTEGANLPPPTSAAQTPEPGLTTTLLCCRAAGRACCRGLCCDVRGRTGHRQRVKGIPVTPHRPLSVCFVPLYFAKQMQ